MTQSISGVNRTFIERNSPLMKIAFSNALISNAATSTLSDMIFVLKKRAQKKPKFDVYIDILKSLGYFAATAF